MHFVLIYLAVAVPFVAVDMVWLGLMVERLYRPAIGDILRAEPNVWPVTVFYLLYPLGLIGFAVVPAFQEASPVRALLLGLMFGCFTYATYDLTNHATLRNWSTALTISDICWGSLLAAGSAYCGYLVASRVLGAG